MVKIIFLKDKETLRNCVKDSYFGNSILTGEENEKMKRIGGKKKNIAEKEEDEDNKTTKVINKKNLNT